MTLSKLIYIPRAVGDCIQVLFHHSLSWPWRWSLMKALLQLKWTLWRHPAQQSVSVMLQQQPFLFPNHSDAQTLLKEIWLQQVYQPQTPLPANARMLDLGANIGNSSAYMMRLHGVTTVVAYEPDAQNFLLLQQNLGQHTSVQLHQQAVGTKHETRSIALSHASGINKQFDMPGTDAVISVADIADVLAPGFDLVKMDIEGAEWPLLQRIATLNLLQKANYWMIELHALHAHTAEWATITALCTEQGYQIDRIDCVWHLYKMPDR